MGRNSEWLRDYAHDLMEDGDFDQEATRLVSAADTIDALVAALEDAWVYVPENARGTQTKIKAALALARGGK